MRVPDHLDTEAKAFWRKYAKTLADLGRLTETDLPNFEMLARNWSLFRSIDPTTDSKAAILYMALNKQILAQLKSFGLTPEARKRLNLDATRQDTDEFGIPQ